MKRHLLPIRLSFFSVLLFSVAILHAQEAPAFPWPDGKRAALSLSFDDARLSNVDVGAPLFNKHGAKATFYVVPESMQPRLDKWKQAVADGHEIGNHTLVHPCSGNFDWARAKALENYNLAAMRRELVTANEQIEALLGVTPVSFAYSCGQTYVGRGGATRSYVPLVDELFRSGRGWLDEAGNDPWYADLAQLQGIEMDGKDFESDIKPILEQALADGSWVVLAGHEIGEGGFQTTRVAMLEALLDYVQQPNSGIWLATVGEVTAYVRQQRQRKFEELADALTLAASFDAGYDADLARGDRRLHTAPAYDQLKKARPGMTNADVERLPGQGRYGAALRFKAKSDPVVFYPAEDNIGYDVEDWGGAISLWLSLDPEQDLAPGYTDPIQITDAGYNDAALWVDFSDKNPRSFRMGVYGDLAVWNPDNVGPNDNPAFNERLLPAEHRPFGRDIWTHVVITFAGLNSGQGQASFYINGRPQGSRDIPEPFTWTLGDAKIFLGLNYIGLLDEVALFDRPLTAEEVTMLYNLDGGLAKLVQAARD